MPQAIDIKLRSKKLANNKLNIVTVLLTFEVIYQFGVPSSNFVIIN
jgi:hypothetical protein